MLIELRRLQNRLRVASLALAGMLVACATAQAQDPVTADRELLVEAYIAALNECDSDKLGGLLHPEHKGFLIRGGVSDGMTDTALAVQCAAGFQLALSAIETQWMQTPEANVQTVALVLSGTLTHPKRGTNPNNLRVTLTAERESPEAPLLIKHSHLSALQ